MIRRIDRDRRDYRTYRETINTSRKMDYNIINKAREYMGDEYAFDFLLEELTDGALSRVASAFKRWMDETEEIDRNING